MAEQYSPLEPRLRGYFNLKLRSLSKLFRNLIPAEVHLIWDKLTPEQRQDRIKGWDHRHNPANAEEYKAVGELLSQYEALKDERRIAASCDGCSPRERLKWLQDIDAKIEKLDLERNRGDSCDDDEPESPTPKQPTKREQQAKDKANVQRLAHEIWNDDQEHLITIADMILRPEMAPFRRVYRGRHTLRNWLSNMAPPWIHGRRGRRKKIPVD